MYITTGISPANTIIGTQSYLHINRHHLAEAWIYQCTPFTKCYFIKLSFIICINHNMHENAGIDLLTNYCVITFNTGAVMSKKVKDFVMFF